MKVLNAIGLLLALVILGGSLASAAAADGPANSSLEVWQVSRWAVPSGGSVGDMLSAVADMAGKYPRVAVAGSDPTADSLAGLLQSRLGNDRVQRTGDLSSADQLRALTSSARPDLVLRVQNGPPEPISPGEKFIIQSQDTLDMQNAILAGAHVLRIAEGTLKDPRTVADPLTRKTLENLQKLFGDWSTPQAKAALGQWDKDSETAQKWLDRFKLASDANHDIVALSRGKWTPEDSQLIDQGIHWLAGSGTTMLLKNLMNLSKADAEALPGVVGFGELADGITQQIHDGHFTIDSLEHYMDSSVAASWTVVALLLTDGNVRVAQHVSQLAVAAAKAGRDATAAPIKDVYDHYFGTEINDAFDQWQVEQISNARRGKPLVSWEDWAKANGFNPDTMSAQQKAVAQSLFYSCQQLAAARSSSNTVIASAHQPQAPNVSFTTPPPPNPDDQIVKRKPDASLPPPESPRAIPSVDPAIEKALLAEDWARVLIISDDPTDSPRRHVEQMIKAHADLATNRNNESFSLFDLNSDQRDLTAWVTWTDGFASRYPTSAVAYYLRADAQARSRHWDHAIADFSKALQLQTTFALADNARGVCYALNGRWDDAAVDFDAACQADPQLADVYINRAVICVQRSVGRSDTIAILDPVFKKLSPDSELAAITRDCLLFGTGDWEQAQSGLDHNGTNGHVFQAFARVNLAVVHEADAAVLEQVARTGSDDPGVQMNFNTQTPGLDADSQARFRNIDSLNTREYQMSVALAASDGMRGSLHDMGDVATAASLIPGPYGRASALASTVSHVLEAPLDRASSFAQSDLQQIQAERQQQQEIQMKSNFDRFGTQGSFNAVNNWAQRDPGFAATMGQDARFQQMQQQMQMRGPLSNPGGVKIDMRRARINHGYWGVYVPFGLEYSGVTWAKTAEKAGHDESK